MTIIDIILAAIVIVILLYVVQIIMSMIALPPQIKQLAWLIIGLIILIIVLGWFGIGGISLDKPIAVR